jgi:DNA-binding winged helix-turn-helix (wHTH) protein
MRLRFSELVFDSDSRRLTRAGEPVHLEPKAFELLELLLERRPAAVSKAAIRDRLWPRSFVSESSLTTLVAQLRRALGEDDRFLRTVHGFGYAFDGEAAVLGAAAATTRRTEPVGGVAAGPCLLWQDQAFRLAEGESVLGRDAAAQVLVDVPGVSRRHARIVVRGAEVAVEDLGSKNGTFVGDRRVDGPTLLADRDRVRLGHTVLVYRCARLPGSTETEAT